MTSVLKLTEAIPPALARHAVLSRYASGQSIYRSKDKVEHWYLLVSGAARKSVFSGDGRRHIVDFVLPNDPFGLSAAGLRRFYVEALVPDTVIARFPLAVAERLADSNPEVSRYIRKTAFNSIVHLQQRLVILGQTSALEKVSAFLLEISDRRADLTMQTVQLPMSRYDIADYVGLAVETVSRMLTQLRRTQVIEFPSARCMRIGDRRGLEDLANGQAGRAAHLAALDALDPPVRRTQGSHHGIDVGQGTQPPGPHDCHVVGTQVRSSGKPHGHNQYL